MQRIPERLVLKHQCSFIRTLFFTEHLQWLLLTVSGFQPAALFKKGLQQRRFSVNFAKFLITSFDRTAPDDCFLCLPLILRSFSDHLFYRGPLGNYSFHVQVAELQPPDIIKSISQVLFQALYPKTRRSYFEAFMKIPENPRKLSVNKLIYNEAARCRPAS